MRFPIEEEASGGGALNDQDTVEINNTHGAHPDGR